MRARIGGDAAPGAVFVSPESTGETWRGEAREDDLILTRILTLEGIEMASIAGVFVAVE